MLELVETALAMPEQSLLTSAEILGYAERALELSGGFRIEYWVATVDALMNDGQNDRALQVVDAALEEVPNNLDLQQRRRRLTR